MRIFVLLCLALFLESCVSSSGRGIQAQEHYAPVPEGVIMVVGDSLSNGYGMERHEGWVALLQDRMLLEQRQYRIVNMSRNGVTTFVGRRSIRDQLELYQPDIVIIALGGNDALLRLPLEKVRENLDAMLSDVYAKRARALLVAVALPKKMGLEYVSGFSAIYTGLSGKYGTPLVEHVLDGVYGEEGLMQADGVHPGLLAQQRMLDNVWPTLKPLLE